MGANNATNILLATVLLAHSLLAIATKDGQQQFDENINNIDNNNDQLIDDLFVSTDGMDWYLNFDDCPLTTFEDSSLEIQNWQELLLNDTSDISFPSHQNPPETPSSTEHMYTSSETPSYTVLPEMPSTGYYSIRQMQPTEFTMIQTPSTRFTVPERPSTEHTVAEILSTEHTVDETTSIEHMVGETPSTDQTAHDTYASEINSSAFKVPKSVHFSKNTMIPKQYSRRNTGASVGRKVSKTTTSEKHTVSEIQQRTYIPVTQPSLGDTVARADTVANTSTTVHMVAEGSSPRNSITELELPTNERTLNCVAEINMEEHTAIEVHPSELTVPRKEKLPVKRKQKRQRAGANETTTTVNTAIGQRTVDNQQDATVGTSICKTHTRVGHASLPPLIPRVPPSQRKRSTVRQQDMLQHHNAHNRTTAAQTHTVDHAADRRSSALGPTVRQKDIVAIRQLPPLYPQKDGGRIAKHVNNVNDKGKAPTTVEESNNTISSAYVKQIRRLFELSITGADVPHKLFDQAMAHLDAGGSLRDRPITDLNESLIKKLREACSMNKILQTIPLMMITMGRSEIVQPIFSEIKVEAETLFGRNILGHLVHIPVKIFMFDNRVEEYMKKLKMTNDKMAFQNEKYALVLFFYIRLNRKLSGLLEAPYLADGNTENSDKKLTLRRTLALLMRAMMKRVHKEFETFVRNNEPKHYEMVRSAVKMNFTDTVKEILKTVEMAIRLIMAPLIGQEIFENENFTEILKEIVESNVTTLVIQFGDNSIDKLIKMPTNLNIRENFGKIVVVEQIIQKSLCQINAKYVDPNGQPSSNAQEKYSTLVVRNLDLILHIQQLMLRRLLSLQFEVILGNTELLLQNKWKIAKDFLECSVAQLQNALSGSDDGSTRAICTTFNRKY